MASINNRTEFSEYCLRRLGAPEISIDVTPEQVDDRVDDALQHYQDYHYDGSERLLYRHQITEEDVANKYITIPEHITGISGLFPLAGAMLTSSDFLFDAKFQFMAAAVNDMNNVSIIPWHMAMERISLFERYFSQTPPFRYNRHTDKLYIDAAWGTQIKVGKYLLIDCHSTIDPVENPDVWNDRWLKRYATALIKRQWGENLKKFQGVQILNGITLDGKTIYDEAVEEIKTLEDDMLNSYSLPVNGLIS